MKIAKMWRDFINKKISVFIIFHTIPQKWFSFSMTLALQTWHNLLSLSIFRYLPLSISKLWALNLIFANIDLSNFDVIKSTYGALWNLYNFLYHHDHSSFSDSITFEKLILNTLITGSLNNAFNKRFYRQKWYNVCPFDKTTFAVSGKVGIP